MTSPSPSETALATAIADVTARMEAEGRTRMTSAEERLIGEIMEPELDETASRPDTGEEAEEMAENEGRASSKATPKPRATGSRKLLCLISIWLSVWFRPHSLLANEGVPCPGATGDRVCSSNSEGSCFIGSAEHALGRHVLAGLGRHPEWAEAFDVHFGQRAAATISHQCKHSRKTGPMCNRCSTAWYSIVLFYSLVMIGRYRTTTIRRSTRVRDLQCHCQISMLYVRELVNALAGLLTYVRFSQNPEGSPSATYYVASSECVSTTTTVITGSTTSSRVRDSSTGPKSGHIHRTLTGSSLLRLLILLTQVSILKAVNVDVRVGGPAAVPPGASSEAKHSSTREASVPIFERTDPSRIAKRTYHRAYARAARQGGSFYQGRWRDFSWYQKSPHQADLCSQDPAISQAGRPLHPSLYVERRGPNKANFSRN